MNKIAILNTKTLGLDSNSVVLSVAINFIDLDSTNFSIEQMFSDVVFMKFSVKDQIENYSRTYEKDAIKWWKNQPEQAKILSYNPSDRDQTVITGISVLEAKIKSICNPKDIFIFTKSNLYQMSFDSLLRNAKSKLFQHWNYRDIRTFVDCMSNNAKKGSCPIDTKLFSDYNESYFVAADQISECIKDSAMMISCIYSNN